MGYCTSTFEPPEVAPKRNEYMFHHQRINNVTSNNGAKVFACANCNRKYQGKNARSILRRHLKEKHGIEAPRGTRWDNDPNRPKTDEERRQRMLQSKRKWAQKARARKNALKATSAVPQTSNPSTPIRTDNNDENIDKSTPKESPTTTRAASQLLFLKTSSLPSSSATTTSDEESPQTPSPTDNFFFNDNITLDTAMTGETENDDENNIVIPASNNTSTTLPSIDSLTSISPVVDPCLLIHTTAHTTNAYALPPPPTMIPRPHTPIMGNRFLQTQRSSPCHYVVTQQKSIFYGNFVDGTRQQAKHSNTTFSINTPFLPTTNFTLLSSLSHENQSSQFSSPFPTSSLLKSSKNPVNDEANQHTDATANNNTSRARKIIQSTIENGYHLVDLSHLQLRELPIELAELRYHVVLDSQTGVSNKSLKLFLASNNLCSLPGWLWDMNNLKVLSLRNNKLRELPPEISLLSNLVELSVGNNQLSYLPSEILRLPNLDILNIDPNPFLVPSTSIVSLSSKPFLLETHHRHHRQQLVIHQSVQPASLLDLVARQCASLNLIPENPNKPELPVHLLNRVLHARKVNKCAGCYKTFLEPSIEIVIWKDFLLDNTCVPLLVRLCSIKCWKHNLELIDV
ncbi:6521_t:CDS:2 [Ambispora leptoticha]|uniref:6521_t:CDS:1 n=1 Tax=Ambispora leptoticha TaxID=144679 RepID=A0A9N8WGY7_9GLOM|nr:6521_t:CDS:2 [Ambispora leptoticha]